MLPSQFFGLVMKTLCFFSLLHSTLGEKCMEIWRISPCSVSHFWYIWRSCPLTDQCETSFVFSSESNIVKLQNCDFMAYSNRWNFRRVVQQCIHKKFVRYFRRVRFSFEAGEYKWELQQPDKICPLLRWLLFLVFVGKMVALSLWAFVMKYFKQSESPDELLGVLES